VNKAKIVELLKTRDAAVARALVVLTERQTADEQRQESTKHLNGQGFRPCHARMGTSMANFFLRNGYLSPKQIAWWRAPQKDGKMRIAIYAGQLLEIAQSKARKANLGAQTAQDDERYMQNADAQADRKGTRRDELNKFVARCRAEGNPYVGQDAGNLMEERMVLSEQDPQDPRLALIDTAVRSACVSG
jgi:hypothetical protein